MRTYLLSILLIGGSCGLATAMEPMDTSSDSEDIPVIKQDLDRARFRALGVLYSSKVSYEEKLPYIYEQLNFFGANRCYPTARRYETHLRRSINEMNNAGEAERAHLIARGMRELLQPTFEDELAAD